MRLLLMYGDYIRLYVHFSTGGLGFFGLDSPPIPVLRMRLTPIQVSTKVGSYMHIQYYINVNINYIFCPSIRQHMVAVVRHNLLHTLAATHHLRQALL